VSHKPNKNLPHDTPKDTPRVEGGLAMTVPAEPGKAQLAALEHSETLEVAYEAWAEVRAAHQSITTRFEAERRRLKDEGDFVVGTVEAAKRAETPLLPGEPGLVKASDADEFLVQAKAKLKASSEQLAQLAAKTEAAYQEAFTSMRQEVRARVERYLARVKPELRLMIRLMPNDQRVLHVSRVGPDDAVLLFFLLNGRVPSRYDYLFDDSTGDAQKAPPNLYAEEGVAEGAVAPTPADLKRLLASSPAVLAAKACIPFVLPIDGGPSLGWFKQRGPVMEAEVEDGDGFRNLLSGLEAESVAAVLLKLKLEGKIELELVRE
jgi:hypothetical protein